MSKKKWLLLIIVLAAFSYLILSKIYPAIGVSIDNTLGPILGNSANGIMTAISTSPLWISWGNYISAAIGGIIIFALTWKGRTMYHKLVGPKIVGEKREEYVSRQPITPTPISATTRPTEQVSTPPIPIVPISPPPEEKAKQ